MKKTSLRPSAVLAFLLAGLLVLTPWVGAADERGGVTLSLADAVALAIERNLDIAIARIDPASVKHGVTIADSAFDHSFEGSVSYDELQQDPNSRFSTTDRSTKSASGAYIDPLRTGGNWRAELGYQENDSTFATDEFGQVGFDVGAALTLSVSQPLLRNYGISINRTSVDQAMNDHAISELQFHDRVMQVVEDVERAYWTLVGQRRELEVAQESLNLAEDFLRQTKIKVDVGTLPPIEITTAEAELASRQEAVIVREATVRNAEDNLRALLRVPPESPEWERALLPANRPSFEKVAVDVETAIATAVAKRSSMGEAKIRLQNAELSERYRRNQTKWDLTLSARLRSTGNNFESVPLPGGDFTQVQGSRTDSFSEIIDLDNTNWNVSAVLGIPLGNRRAKAEHARARLAVDQASLNIDAAEQTLRVEVRQAAREVTTSAKRVESARANVVLQKKKMEAEQKRYENGLSTSFRVLEFQRDFLEAQSREISAVIDHTVALAHLARVKGTLLEEREIVLE